jgi:oxaloacetate decarboxylase (Na+ extruding) subunit alpha
VKDKILASPRAKDFASWTPPQPSIEELRRQFGGAISDDELILRLLVPEKEIEAMRAAGPPARDCAIRADGALGLVEALIREGKGAYLHYEGDGLSITLSRSGS